MERWRRIIREAAEQSGRVRLPKLAQATSFSQVCKAAPTDVPALMLSLAERATSVGQVLENRTDPRPEEIRLYVGPEGGFTPGEVQRGTEAGLELVSLGPRTLRTETAPLVASAILLYAMGDMD
jgi:16S rRNA (uracil1498-N3)-methyltransferase